MPSVIYTFELKDNVMKSKMFDPTTGKEHLKTVNDIDEKTFNDLTDDLQKEMNLVGPWKGTSVVARCAPKISW